MTPFVAGMVAMIDVLLLINIFPSFLVTVISSPFTKKQGYSKILLSLAIARALINDPAIIMCDEPTGNLDSKNTSIVFDLFQKLAKEFGQTIIAVTHDNDFARGLIAL